MALPLSRVAVAVAAMVVARAAWAADAPCPSPEAIAAELKRLPESEAAAQVGQSQVTVEGARMRIVLRDSAGHTVGVRDVEAPRECRQRAAVAAVVLAAWSHAWPDLEAPVTPAAPPERQAEVGVQAVVHHDGKGMAPGAGLLGGVQLWGQLGAGVVGDFALARDQQLGPGSVGYSFVRLGVGPLYRARLGDTWIDAGIFPQLVRLAVTPRELPAARAAALWAAAVQARVRLGMRWGRVMPFLSASAGRRFVRDRLTLDDDPETAELSPWDLDVGVGVALQLGAAGPMTRNQ